MTPYDRHLQAAHGYLELGLPLEANEELDALAPEYQTDLRVVSLRVEVYRELGRWEQMEIMATVLCQHCPDQAQWPLALAYVTRRAQHLVEAREVLWEAWARFPQNDTIQFNLACYECQLGRLVEAREHLNEARRLDGACRGLALEDADLAPLRSELRASTQK